MQVTHNSQIVLKKKEIGRLILLDFKMYYRGTALLTKDTYIEQWKKD